MCQERRKTRDLLLEYDVVPMYHHAGGLSIIYPWENMETSVFEKQFFKMACDNGYTGTPEDFWTLFSSSKIIPGELMKFPVPGDEKILYFDYVTGIMYAFRNVTNPEVLEKLITLGGTNVGHSEDNLTTYVYIPIQALLIEGTIINGGEA